MDTRNNTRNQTEQNKAKLNVEKLACPPSTSFLREEEDPGNEAGPPLRSRLALGLGTNCDVSVYKLYRPQCVIHSGGRVFENIRL